MLIKNGYDLNLLLNGPQFLRSRLAHLPLTRRSLEAHWQQRGGPSFSRGARERRRQGDNELRPLITRGRGGYRGGKTGRHRLGITGHFGKHKARNQRTPGWEGLGTLRKPEFVSEGRVQLPVICVYI